MYRLLKLLRLLLVFNAEAMVQDTKVEDMRLPPLIVSRIVDRAIGPSGTVSKEARTAIGRAASVCQPELTDSEADQVDPRFAIGHFTDLKDSKVDQADQIFIHQMSSHACEYATNKRRKVLTPEDIFQAFHIIECDHLVGPLQESLEVWKSNKAQKSEETRKRKADKKGAERSSLTADGEDSTTSFTIAPSEEMRLREDELDEHY